MPLRRFQIADTARGKRLDSYLAEQMPALSRSRIERLIAEGKVTVNGAATKAGYRLRGGEVIEVSLPPERSAELVPEDIPLHIVYEDKEMLAVDKPAGMVVHPAPGHESGTLVNALLAHWPELASLDRAGIVHRLDRYTSGLLLVAKTEEIRQMLQDQFRHRQVQKVYLALVMGRLTPREGRIEAPLGRDPLHRQKMAVVSHGRPASTGYRVCEYLGKFTFLEVYPRTGRSHQVRVHLSAVGHPVVGDRVYGPPSDPLKLGRYFLHAWRLGFTHPSEAVWIQLETELPPALTQVLEELRRD